MVEKIKSEREIRGKIQLEGFRESSAGVRKFKEGKRVEEEDEEGKGRVKGREIR